MSLVNASNSGITSCPLNALTKITMLGLITLKEQVSRNGLRYESANTSGTDWNRAWCCRSHRWHRKSFSWSSSVSLWVAPVGGRFVESPSFPAPENEASQCKGRYLNYPQKNSGVCFCVGLLHFAMVEQLLLKPLQLNAGKIVNVIRHNLRWLMMLMMVSDQMDKTHSSAWEALDPLLLLPSWPGSSGRRSWPLSWFVKTTTFTTIKTNCEVLFVICQKISTILNLWPCPFLEMKKINAAAPWDAIF